MKSLKALALGATIAITISTQSLANDIPSSENQLDRYNELQISKPGDLELSCNALTAEALNMSQVILTTQNVKDNSDIKSHGVTAAGAVGSFLIGSVTGGIGLAVGGFLVNHNIEEHSDQADQIQDFAEQRRTLMVGIHNAKGCYGPIEHVMQTPKESATIKQIALNTHDQYQASLQNRYND